MSKKLRLRIVAIATGTAMAVLPLSGTNCDVTIEAFLTEAIDLSNPTELASEGWQEDDGYWLGGDGTARDQGGFGDFGGMGEL